MIKNKIGVILSLTLLFVVSASAQRVAYMRINEVLVINEDNFVDDYGKRSGWIELFNSSAGTVNISGCFLTDDPNNPRKYPIPKGDVLTKIPPGQHILFWADGNASRGTFHLNFKLDPARENYIALYDADGKTLVDEIRIPAGQKPDVSYGRKVDGLQEWTTLPKVTPSTNNLTLDSNEKIENFQKNDAIGLGMTITAMLVVFLGLILLYVVFKFVGKSAIKMSNRRARKAGVENIPAKGHTEEGAIFAAIATALYEVTEDVHDMENTVLTIHKVTRRYSPWNSKIYNMREFSKK
ncbi:MAG: lamin tail domain-containing protein [Tannerella sp.]|jgi:Na+-transporting methylmalonyl-CoA/oxaloacetate decarboxylase gamma subunit|nr:lamin tail domain-containing protein [Tannerella sp.]